MVDTTFTDEMATASPVPGGGGAAAYAGALAAALGSMVGNITIPKKSFADVADELKGAVATLDACRAELLELIDDDARVFSALAATWKMPRDTEKAAAKRHDAEQKALVGACDVPIQIMRVCAKVIELDDFLVRNSSKMAISDVGSSAVLAKAAMQAAALNVYVNTRLMDDTERVADYEHAVREVVRAFADKADMTYDYVFHEVADRHKK